MIEIGRDRLNGFGERVSWLERDLSDRDWAEGVQGPFDGAISSYAIHLLPDEAKRQIYRWAFGALRPGARLVSADRLRAASPALDAEYHEHWMQFIVCRTKEALGKDVPVEVVRERQQQMDAAVNLHCLTLEGNLALLRDAGFQVVECFWKDRQRAVFGGVAEERHADQHRKDRDAR